MKKLQIIFFNIHVCTQLYGITEQRTLFGFKCIKLCIYCALYNLVFQISIINLEYNLVL